MALLKHRYRKLSDEKLMEFIQRGDTSAFDELYHRYSRRLLSYFFRELGGDEQKAQDFLQEIFLKVIEKHALFDTERNFSTWIFTVAYNMCKNEYRRQNTRASMESITEMDRVLLLPEDESHQAEDKLDRGEFQKALYSELEKFEDGQRSAFLLRYQQNLTIKEISEVLACPEGTVKSRLFHTTRKLAKKLKTFNPYKSEVPEDEKIK